MRNKNQSTLKNSTVLEFFGLPGAGKTTVLNCLQHQLKNKNIRFVSNEDIHVWLVSKSLMFKIRLLIKYLAYSLSVYAQFIAEAGFRHFFKPPFLRRTTDFISSSLYLKEYLSRHKYDICLLDQWGLQFIWSAWIGLKQPEKRFLICAIKKMQQKYPRTYVYYETSAQIAADRITQRTHGNSRFENLNTATVKKMMTSGQKLFNNILEAAEKANTDILILNAQNTPEENASMIIEQLQKSTNVSNY